MMLCGTRSTLLTLLAMSLSLGLRTEAQTTSPASVGAAHTWPAFRGSQAGVGAGDVPADWDGPSGRNILWKSPILLPGRNSPIVWGDSIFLCGATKERQEVFCFNADTGALRWQKVVGTPDPAKAPKIMEDTGYAASTMTTDGQRVFAIFVTGDLVALNFSGEIIWKKAFGDLDNQYGHATSLVMWQDRLILQLDQGLEAEHGKSQIMALDGATGNVIWKTPRPVANSWTSPIVVTTPSGPQIITSANPFAIAYDPQTGSELWRVKCMEGDVAPSPAYSNGKVFVAMENGVAPLIKTEGRGDITKTHIAWEADENLPDIVSPVATDQVVIVVMSYGTVTCWDAADGKKLWTHEFDNPFHASPLVINNIVHLIDRKGITHRFEAAREFKLLNQPAIGEPISATPAIANNRIFIRSEGTLYCIGSR